MEIGILHFLSRTDERIQENSPVQLFHLRYTKAGGPCFFHEKKEPLPGPGRFSTTEKRLFPTVDVADKAEALTQLWILFPGIFLFWLVSGKRKGICHTPD